MRAIPTSIPDVLLIEPHVFGDERGFFFESFNQKIFAELTGVNVQFVQDNHSRSVKGVLRGLHYQLPQKAQGKLVRVIAGELFDVVVDIRKSSPTFGHSFSTFLSAENKRQLWIPAGFAHGFVALSEVTDVLYKTTDFWAPEYERSILWSDPAIAIAWPLQGEPILSAKDRQGLLLSEVEVFA